VSSITSHDVLQRVLEHGRLRAASTAPEHARLWEALAAATEGGKRFRPALVTAAHDALGGTSPVAVAEVGAAIELLHTAFVIHDDVIDGDDVRRGRLNVSGTFRAHALGAGATACEATELSRAAGILAGDLALAAAIRTVATCSAPRETIHRLLDLFDAGLHTAASGELADVRLSLNLSTASLPESLQMEEQKTSSYSFALPLQAGALLAAADEETVCRLGEAGRLVGIAFQLVDDLIGVFGDPAQTGKSATSDLRTRKQTPLLTHARSTPEWSRILLYLGRDLTEDELAEARRLLTASGSRLFVEALAETHLSSAKLIVEDLGIPADVLPEITMRPPGLAATNGVAA
jgi:geranylgeranyl diphosphate synthase type II